MSQHHSTETPEILALQTAFQSIAKSVATSIVDALVQPLQQEIESRVNAIIVQSTKDIHQKIAAAIGHIQPIQIPISLLAKPVVQPDPEVVAVSTPTPCPPAQPVPVAAATKVLTTASYAEPEPEPEPFRAVVTGAELSNNAEPTLKRDKKRTPEKNRKNFAATIVGLLPGQAHIIKNDFKFAKLSFVHADARNSGQLVALSKSHNPVLFMTDFVRHASVESVRSVHGNWVYVTGGMNTLREKLNELYQQHQKQDGLLVR